jgi:hypothetical protein
MTDSFFRGDASPVSLRSMRQRGTKVDSVEFARLSGRNRARGDHGSHLSRFNSGTELFSSDTEAGARAAKRVSCARLASAAASPCSAANSARREREYPQQPA